MKSWLNQIVSVIAVLSVVMLLSCGGGGSSNTDIYKASVRPTSGPGSVTTIGAAFGNPGPTAAKPNENVAKNTKLLYSLKVDKTEAGTKDLDITTYLQTFKAHSGQELTLQVGLATGSPPYTVDWIVTNSLPDTKTETVTDLNGSSSFATTPKAQGYLNFTIERNYFFGNRNFLRLNTASIDKKSSDYKKNRTCIK